MADARHRNRPELILVAALGQNRVIGRDNQLCWHIPEDLARFRRITAGEAVLMGRKTWESLPAAVRPLPGRQNVVVSRQPDYAAPGAQVATSLEAALALVERERVFVIGGEQLYCLAMPCADILELTEVELAPEGDAFFPELPAGQWLREHHERHISTTGAAFAYARYRRAPTRKG